jgi:hypothetical protein
MEDKVNIMPLYHVLIGRADTFSDAQLIALMREPETLAGMECTLAEMYIRNGYGHTGLNAMLDDDDIAIETKEYIVSHADYSADELCGIFRKSENRTAVIAIKRISMCDSETALQLVNETLQAGKNGKEISDDQYIAICIGIANYFEETHADAETDRTKNDYIAVLKQIFGQADSETVQDQAIYAMGRLHDYELFTWIIENDQVVFPLKVTVIERNVQLMKDRISTAKSADDIRTVCAAMKLHPVTDIAPVLRDAIAKGTLPDSEEMRLLIREIETNGIKSVGKYEN